MKMIRNIIEYLIAIAVIPAIVLTVVSVTELKDVKNVQYQLLSEEDGVFKITQGTYEKLVANKRIKKYELESNYPLITQEEMDRATWELDDLKNEIYIDENGEKRIRLNVGQITLDGSEDWRPYSDINTNHIGFLLINFLVDKNVMILPNNSINAVISWKNSIDYVGVGFADHDNNSIQFSMSTYNVYLKVEESIASNPLELKQYLSQNPITITYELADKQDRPVEVYDFSKFRLVYDKNRIRVIFDIDDSYYLWEITNDDKMIPIYGRHDLGTIWNVKFYVYEIQQPLIRSLVLLIPLIVVSGVLFYMYNMLKKKDLMS